MIANALYEHNCCVGVAVENSLREIRRKSIAPGCLINDLLRDAAVGALLPCLGVHESNLLKARVIIHAYNEYVRLLSPSLLVGFSTTNSTWASEPTLSWNQFHQLFRYVQDMKARCALNREVAFFTSSPVGEAPCYPPFRARSSPTPRAKATVTNVFPTLGTARFSLSCGLERTGTSNSCDRVHQHHRIRGHQVCALQR